MDRRTEPVYAPKKRRFSGLMMWAKLSFGPCMTIKETTMNMEPKANHVAKLQGFNSAIGRVINEKAIIAAPMKSSPIKTQK